MSSNGGGGGGHVCPVVAGASWSVSVLRFCPLFDN